MQAARLQDRALAAAAKGSSADGSSSEDSDDNAAGGAGGVAEGAAVACRVSKRSNPANVVMVDYAEMQRLNREGRELLTQFEYVVICKNKIRVGS